METSDLGGAGRVEAFSCLSVISMSWSSLYKTKRAKKDQLEKRREGGRSRKAGPDIFAVRTGA